MASESRPPASSRRFNPTLDYKVYMVPGLISVLLMLLCCAVRSNAALFGKEYQDELHRVIIHDILHLCGINDKGPGEREQMEAAENRALDMLAGFIFFCGTAKCRGAVARQARTGL